MAKNDKILIDGIIDERVDIKLPSDKRDEAFEYFVFEQYLKDYDLTEDEISQGSVDGRNDGGIDGFFIFVNGHLLVEPDKFHWPKSGSVLEIWIVTCKLHDTFKQAPLDNLAATIQELFDFSLDNSELKLDYSQQIKTARKNFKYAYRKASPKLSQFSINFCYASRGDTKELGEPILSRAEQIKQITEDAFGNCQSKFSFLGASELIELHRKSPNFTLELPILKELSSGENYILLVNLKDYYNFIQDKGKLRRYLFDSNVRDFMGLNRVNEDIRSTLTNQDSPDFWWLNNGITILATHAYIIGDNIHIQDIQIVNGLQTSESIFRHFENAGIDSKNRSVLVKVLVSTDNKVRDTIIRATNNQTTVELASLHATDKIQRDIEDVLKQNDFYYERRTNFYKNQGVPSDKIINPLYIAAGYVNLILKEADQASKLKSRFMKLESSYNHVFSQSVDLNVWPKIAAILKRTDIFLETVRPSGKSNTENFLKSRRQLVSFLTLSRMFKSFNFSVVDIMEFDLKKYSSDEFDSSWNIIKTLGPYVNNSRVKKSHFIGLCNKAAKLWNISGIERINNYDKESEFEEKPKKRDEFKIEHKRNENIVVTQNQISVTREFALEIHKLLPKQPWKPGVDKIIVSTLNCSRKEYFEAVKLLIEEGLCFKQINGVVYNRDNKIIAVDEERVDVNTLQLKA